MGLYGDNGKENGSYYSILGYLGIMEKKVEATIVHWGYMGIMEQNMEATIVHWGYMGTMEENMEATIVYWGYMGITENKKEATIVYWGYMGIMEKKMEATIICLCYIETMGKKLEPTTHPRLPDPWRVAANISLTRVPEDLGLCALGRSLANVFIPELLEEANPHGFGVLCRPQGVIVC